MNNEVEPTYTQDRFNAISAASIRVFRAMSKGTMQTKNKQSQSIPGKKKKIRSKLVALATKGKHELPYLHFDKNARSDSRAIDPARDPRSSCLNWKCSLSALMERVQTILVSLYQDEFAHETTLDDRSKSKSVASKMHRLILHHVTDAKQVPPALICDSAEIKSKRRCKTTKRIQKFTRLPACHRPGAFMQEVSIFRDQWFRTQAFLQVTVPVHACKKTRSFESNGIEISPNTSCKTTRLPACHRPGAGMQKVSIFRDQWFRTQAFLQVTVPVHACKKTRSFESNGIEISPKLSCEHTSLPAGHRPGERYKKTRSFTTTDFKQRPSLQIFVMVHACTPTMAMRQEQATRRQTNKQASHLTKEEVDYKS